MILKKTHPYSTAQKNLIEWNFIEIGKIDFIDSFINLDFNEKGQSDSIIIKNQ